MDSHLIRAVNSTVSAPPLSAPKNHKQIHELSIIILCVAILSATGALWMIMGFILNKSLRTFRHQLILGLAISDLCMAVNFLSSAAVNLSGPHDIGTPDHKTFCSFNGFMIQTFVDQTDYWVLSIAACTFIMVNDNKSMSEWIQKKRIVIYLLPWILSLTWATIGLFRAGYGDIGAWCWFTSDKTRLLVNFLPRWIIIVIMLGLYIRLHFIIHRAHNSFESFDDEYGYGGGSRSFPEAAPSDAPWATSVNLTKMSDNGDNRSDQERIIPSTPKPSKVKRSKGSADLRRLSYQMMLYPLVYMLVWALPTCIRIYQAVSGKSAPFGIATADKSCIVVQGLLDAMVYGFNEKTWLGWKEIFSRKKTR